MQQNKTLGFLKKRILDTLDENSAILSGKVVADTNTDVLLKKMPDCINASLSRMYESLPVKNEKRVMKLYKPEIVFYCESFCNGQGKAYEFEKAITKAAVISGFFGSGSVSFVDENDNICKEIALDNTKGELEYLRQSFEFDTPVNKVIFSSDISLKDFTVYKNDDSLEGQMIPPYGFVSFKMPERMKELKAVMLEGAKNIPLFRVITANEAGYIKSCNDDYVFIEYKKSPCFIDETTPDEYVLELEGCAFEALVCLAASELCGPDRQGTYSKLLYKYLDLSESLYTNKPGHLLRNSFYKKSAEKRW